MQNVNTLEMTGKIAIISDIHGNSESLDAVLEDIGQQEIERIFCLGDTVDYGPNPNEVISTLSERRIPTLRGNHDHYAVEGLPDADWHIDVAESYHWTTKTLTSSSRRFLKGLSSPSRVVALNKKRVLLVHGTPGDPLEGYLITDTTRTHSKHYRSGREIAYMMRAYCPDVDAFFGGHVHIPFIKQLPGGALAINVGSVGQPRDSDSRAAYCVTDGTYEGTSIRRVAYDVKKAQKKILDSGLPAWNAERLEMGI